MPDSISPDEILTQVAPEEVPASQPPGDSNYRPADVDGISCASCAKFNYGGVIDEDGGMIPTGTCDLYEAQVRGDYVSDSYAEDTPPIDAEGNDADGYEFSDQRTFNEVHLADTEVKSNEEGLIRKTVLRTGTLPGIPTKGGLVNKALRIVKEGKSDPDEGIISMAELKRNFDNKVIPNVQVPLSDTEYDHKNTTAVNKGFVEALEIEEDEDGEAQLLATLKITEPEVRDRMLRGTYADVSCGIPWQVRSRGKLSDGAVLEHVAITNRPFAPNLGPFLAASDEAREQAEVEHFGEVTPEDAPEKPTSFSYEQQRTFIGNALRNDLQLNSDYFVADIEGDKAVIKHQIATDSEWKVPFVIDGEGEASVAKIEDWEQIHEEVSAEPQAPKPAPVAMSDLEYARRLRELRLSQRNSDPNKEVSMPLTREGLEALELNDEQRVAFESLLDEKAELAAKTRESDADSRIAELSDLGFSEFPGALKLYRRIMLADDGGPAAVLLSDSGQKESVSALDILDRFIEAIKAGEKVELSAQHLVTDHDDPPPADADAEVPFEERLAAGKQAIGQS